jgi:hypothetical protein
MTPLREAVALPALFLTVALLGGLRIGGTVVLLPPSLTALVLAVLLFGTLARGRVLVPHALLHGGRTGLENVSGAIVLAALFAASAQAVNLLLPERGLLHAAFAIFLFVQLLTMNAAGAGRPGVLRSVLVLFGSLFVLRFIVVEALYAADGGLLQRLLRTLMSGISLGGIAYDPNAPVTGYIAFFALALYVIGLLLLPTAPSTALVRRPPPPPSAIVPTTVVLLLLAGAGGCGQAGGTDRTAGAGAPPPAREQPPAGADGRVSAAQRTEALKKAQVWRQPATPVPRAALGVNPAGPGAFKDSAVVECRMVVKGMGGTTPKFDCERPDGDVIRVKYGRGNPEIHAEVAATRLLTALGFGADRMFVVRRIACAGCPRFPYQSLRCLDETGLENLCFPKGIDFSRVTEFEHAVIERRLDGRRIESTEDQGWAWFELDTIDPAAGGAPRAHVDALKLLAVLIAHWDNKAPNQRLLCLPGGDTPEGGCTRPLAILQDVGASFGPTKLDLHNWRAQPVWADPRTCLVSMEHLPWGGGTFPEQRISEAGRQFLLNLLTQLSSAQVKDLFAGARVQASEGITGEGRQPRAWAAAFADKVRQIAEAGPCPGDMP